MAIRMKRTTTTGYTWQAGDTVEGQLGLNLTDGTLHFKKSNGTYVNISEGGGGIDNIVEDTTPQLGGNLDVNGNSIVSTSNGNITLSPNGTGKVVISGDLQVDGTTTTINSTTMDIDDINITIAKGAANAAAANGGGITLEGPTTAATIIYASSDDSWNLNKKTSAPEIQVDNININGNSITSTNTNGNIVITPNGTGNIVLEGANWPQADGTSGQVLSTNGAGQLSWVTRSTTSGTVTDVAALTIGTTGTNISSTVATGTTTPVITLNVPNASASNRGALTSTDWSTFNNKQAALVSGTNIRTVNGNTLLGSSNLAVGTVTSVGGTGTVSGLTLTGTVTGSGNLTLGGTLSGVSLTSAVTGTLPIANGGTGATTARNAWDALSTYTATNATTVTLTNTSNYVQHVYGGSGTVITLPSTATMNFGEGFYIINNSGQTTTVNTSTSALVATLTTGQAIRLHVGNTGSNAATSWIGLRDFESVTGTGSNVLSAAPTITGSAVIGGTTFPSATGTTGQVLALSSAGTAAWTTASGGGAQYALVTGATTFFTGTKYVNWTTENHDPNGLVTLSNGTFTLGTAGTYLIQWITTHSLGDPNNWRLFNQTSSTTVATFTMTTPPAGSAYFGGFSAVVAITGSTVFRWDNPNTGSTSILNTPQMLITKIA